MGMGMGAQHRGAGRSRQCHACGCWQPISRLRYRASMHEGVSMFNALLLEKTDAGFSAGLQSLDESRLPEGDVLLRIEHSSLNYKDGLAITNKGPVVRLWPMVAGIDGAGTVLESGHPDWKAGDRVVHNGWGAGESRWGCLAERARLSGAGLVRLPAAFSTRQAMALGTAG